MNWLSLLIPIAYLGILVGSLATFSHLYRQRQITAKLKLAPYFPPHTPRDLYFSLVDLPHRDPSNNAATKIPDSVLRAALLNRAVEDITRILEIRSRKGALNQLLQRGIVGDEIWQRLLRAEQELEIELKDVVAEANALTAGWGQTIFQSASEMAQNRALRERLAGVRSTADRERREWEGVRERARRELEGEGDGASQPGVVTDAAAVVADQAKVVKKSAGSDEDAVLVESPAATVNNAAAATAGGGKGKKKGKR